jgi:hypothetical protein
MGIANLDYTTLDYSNFHPKLWLWFLVVLLPKLQLWFLMVLCSK